MTAPVMELRGVTKRFGRDPGVLARALFRSRNAAGSVVHAVDEVSLIIQAGEVLGLVGESGSGKSTVGRMAVGLLPPSEGQVLFHGQDMGDRRSRSRGIRLKRQMIFQDPFNSLNPRMRVCELVSEAVRVNRLVASQKLEPYVDDVLRRCGLDPTLKKRFPHQFSGGQRQRVAIARALAVKPDFLVWDEAVAALDVSIQSQILNLAMEMKEEARIAYLFISHDLAVVKHISDRVAIMYLGRILEIAETDELFGHPNHPYTQALLAQAPRMDMRRAIYARIKGEVPSPLDPPSGCHFHPRCACAFERCRTERPALREIAPGHHSACHLNDAGSLRVAADQGLR